MIDFSKLTPQAVKAAMTGGTDQWGRYGSRSAHVMYVEPQTARKGRYCKCHCGCGGKAKFRLMANGICMGEGCELSLRREARGK